HPCGADRLGHGVRIAEDITVGADGTAALGKLAAYVRDRRIPLEICPRSNVQTGAAASIAQHPIGQHPHRGVRVTVNTDNRLMSRTSMSIEMQGLVDELGWDLAQLEKVTVNAMKSAFLHYDERVDLIHRIKERYAALRG
ncbi:MAG: adenosine deaminase, partial [Nocardioides sp.]